MRTQPIRFPLALYGLSLLALLAWIMPATALERTVARITDIQGTASLMDSGGNENLRILARLRPGSRIRLEAGASLTLHYPGTRTDFRFTGPDTIQVEPQRAISHAAPPEVRTHADIGVSLDLADSDLGAISMRSIQAGTPRIRMLSPSDTRVLLARPVTFRWQAAPEFGPFELTLSSSLGHTLYHQTTTQTSATLPPHIRLDPGGQYRWRVTATAANGTRASEAANFSTASTEDEARYYRVVGLTTGVVSDLVLHALYLEQMELHDEARKTWQYLETLRPGIRQ